MNASTPTNFLYSVERAYPVSLATLWQAWVDIAALEAWYCPTELAVVPGSVTNRVEVGGEWAVAVDVTKFSMPNAYFFGRYTRVEPLTLLEHTLHYTTDALAATERDESTEFHMVLIEFAERPDGAWCKYSQFGEMPAGEEARAQAGMTSYFDNLGRYLL